MLFLDFIKHLFIGLFFGFFIAIVQASTLLAFHRLRGPFKELSILQKDMLIIQQKIEANGLSRLEYAKKKLRKPLNNNRNCLLKASKIAKNCSRTNHRYLARIKKALAKISGLEKINSTLECNLSDLQAVINANDAKAKIRIEELQRYCYNLNHKMKTFKEKTRSEQSQFKRYAESVQADQNKFRVETGNLFNDMENELDNINDDIGLRVCNVENRVLALIEEKIRSQKRRGWCGKSTRNV